jgi:SAM-dependent methyltransferase
MKNAIHSLVTAGKRRLRGRLPSPNSSSHEYWTEHNVTSHATFSSISQSLECLEWRNSQYLGYIDLMPVSGFDDKVIMDYGCGPGHDLVGFISSSRPARLIGMDVSGTSLAEAKTRVDLHGGKVDLMQIDEGERRVPLANASVDVIHSSGVLHHTLDPGRILREFRRILKPGGFAQVMVYNYDSIWLHLYVAYHRMILNNLVGDGSLRDAFRSSTDGPDCPISDCYTPNQFLELARDSGLIGSFRGAAISVHEMRQLPKRWDALEDRRLNLESRRFLSKLMIDNRGVPTYRGAVAGVDGCFELRVDNSV